MTIPIVVLLVFGGVTIPRAPSFAQTGSAVSSAIPSNATPSIGQQIDVQIRVDVSGVSPPDNRLGSYTGTLNWNTAVLAYNSFSGAPPTGFTGVVNTSTVGSGLITFNGARATGATGNTIVLVVTFDVVGAGVSALDLEYSTMAAAATFGNLLPILTVNDGQVIVGGNFNKLIFPPLVDRTFG